MPSSCDRCSAAISDEELAQGLAVRVDGQLVCPQCVEVLPGEAQVTINQIRALRGLATTTWSMPHPSRPERILFTFTTTGQLTLHRRLLALDGRYDAPPLPPPGERPQLPPREVAARPPRRRLVWIAGGATAALLAVAVAGFVLARGGGHDAAPTTDQPAVSRYSYPVDPTAAWIQARADARCPPELLAAITAEITAATGAALTAARTALAAGDVEAAGDALRALKPPPDAPPFQDAIATARRLGDQVRAAKATQGSPEPTTPSGPTTPQSDDGPPVDPEAPRWLVLASGTSIPDGRLTLPLPPVPGEQTWQLWLLPSGPAPTYIEFGPRPGTPTRAGNDGWMRVQLSNPQLTLDGAQRLLLRLRAGDSAPAIYLARADQPGPGEAIRRNLTVPLPLDAPPTPPTPPTPPPEGPTPPTPPRPPTPPTLPAPPVPDTNATAKPDPDFDDPPVGTPTQPAEPNVDRSVWSGELDFPLGVDPIKQDGSAPLPLPMPHPMPRLYAAKAQPRQPMQLHLKIDPAAITNGGVVCALAPSSDEAGQRSRRQLRAVWEVDRKAAAPIPLTLDRDGWTTVVVPAPAESGTRLSLQLIDAGGDPRPFVLGRVLTVAGRLPVPADLDLTPSPLLLRDRQLEGQRLLMAEIQRLRRRTDQRWTMQVPAMALLYGHVDKTPKLIDLWSKAPDGRTHASVILRLEPDWWPKVQFQPGKDREALRQFSHIAVIAPNGVELDQPADTVSRWLGDLVQQLATGDSRGQRGGFLPVVVIGCTRALSPDQTARFDQLWARLLAELPPGIPVVDARSAHPRGSGKRAERVAALMAEGVRQAALLARRRSPQ